jgi:hypothetical protein
MARCDTGIRSLDRKNESAAVDEALPKFNALNDTTEPRELKPFAPLGREDGGGPLGLERPVFWRAPSANFSSSFNGPEHRNRTKNDLATHDHHRLQLESTRGASLRALPRDAPAPNGASQWSPTETG